MEYDPFKNPIFKKDKEELKKIRDESESYYKEKERDKKKELVNKFFKRNDYLVENLRKWIHSKNIVDKMRCFIECIYISQYLINNTTKEFSDNLKKYLKIFDDIKIEIGDLVREYDRIVLGKDRIEIKLDKIFSYYNELIWNFVLFILDDSIITKSVRFGEEEEEYIPEV